MFVSGNSAVLSRSGAVSRCCLLHLYVDPLDCTLSSHLRFIP